MLRKALGRQQGKEMETPKLEQQQGIFYQNLNESGGGFSLSLQIRAQASSELGLLRLSAGPGQAGPTF